MVGPEPIQFEEEEESEPQPVLLFGLNVTGMPSDSVRLPHTTVARALSPCQPSYRRIAAFLLNNLSELRSIHHLDQRNENEASLTTSSFHTTSFFTFPCQLDAFRHWVLDLGEETEALKADIDVFGSERTRLDSEKTQLESKVRFRLTQFDTSLTPSSPLERGLLGSILCHLPLIWCRRYLPAVVAQSSSRLCQKTA